MGRKFNKHIVRKLNQFRNWIVNQSFYRDTKVSERLINGILQATLEYVDDIRESSSTRRLYDKRWSKLVLYYTPADLDVITHRSIENQLWHWADDIDDDIRHYHHHVLEHRHRCVERAPELTVWDDDMVTNKNEAENFNTED